MMSKSYLRAVTAFLLLSTISACNYQGTNNKNVTPIDQRTRLEKFCTAFMERHPQGLNNDVTLEKMNEDFKKDITDSLKSSQFYLSDFPLKFEGVKTIPGNKTQCYVHFQSWIKPDGFKFEDSHIHEICFDIVGTAPISYAETLVDDKYYLIQGEFKSFIPHNQFKKYASGMAYTPRIGIEKEIIVTSWYNVALGEMLFNITSIKPYKEEHLY